MDSLISEFEMEPGETPGAGSARVTVFAAVPPGIAASALRCCGERRPSSAYGKDGRDPGSARAVRVATLVGDATSIQNREHRAGRLAYLLDVSDALNYVGIMGAGVFGKTIYLRSALKRIDLIVAETTDERERLRRIDLA